MLNVFNSGPGRTVSVNALVDLLAATTEVEPNIEHLSPQPGDVPRTWADIGRARERLGFDPRFPHEEGLRRFVAWYREQHAGT